MDYGPMAKQVGAEAWHGLEILLGMNPDVMGDAWEERKEALAVLQPPA
jgi:hypothetical protein